VQYVVVETWGAGAGGLGGHVGGTIAVTPGEVLRVRVGGSNGFNGGGAGGAFGGNGGGATDGRRGGESLPDRVVIAGRGGGVGTVAGVRISPEWTRPRGMDAACEQRPSDHGLHGQDVSGRRAATDRRRRADRAVVHRHGPYERQDVRVHGRGVQRDRYGGGVR